MKHILIIEDSKIINNIIHKELSKLKFKIDQAFTLSDARGFLKSNRYDLIILDLHLPDGEGSELIANIQSLTRTKVVVLTSSQDEDLREELFQYGIIDYLVKDKNLIYSISEIVKIINSISSPHRDKILIIDDSKFICKQVKTILEPRNYIVQSAFYAKDGILKLQADEFNLVILDMELPDMHGVKVLEIIRKDIRFLNLPILVLSGTSTPEIIRTVLKNGANDFLKKPFVFEEFILKVDLWIDYFKKEKELEEKTYKLQFINQNLENLVYKEVEKNRKKDKIMLAQSRQAQMGEMIAMIAHQWRQPLNAISAAVGVINMKAQRDRLTPELAKEVTSKIDRYLQYLSSTIDDFRDFFKPQKEKRVTNLELILSKALAITEASIKDKNIELNIDIKSIKVLTTYENELIQVVINILKNAEDAFESKNVKNPKIDIIVDSNVLIIADNAGGIPKYILEKIFDPYFSTKKKKNGTGLGLYMSKVIVEDHCDGKLVVTNSSDGAVFQIIM